jgi:hypothetical protein
MANAGKWTSRLDALDDRLSEIEEIVMEKYKPPSRFGATFRYLVQNLETLQELVEDYRKTKGVPNGLVRGS